MDSPELPRRKKIGTAILVVVFSIITGIAMVFSILSGELVVVVILALAALILGTVLGKLLTPYNPWLGESVQRVSEEQESHLRSLSEDAGVSPEAVWVVTNPKRFIQAGVGGLTDGNYHLLVENTLFEDYSDEEREALITMIATQARKHFYTYRVVAPLLLAIVYLSTLIVIQHSSLSLPETVQRVHIPSVLFVIAYFLLARHGQRKALTADRAAANRTSPETVIDLIEYTVTEVQKKQLKQNWLLSLLRMSPSPHKRIQRLQEEQPQ